MAPLEKAKPPSDEMIIAGIKKEIVERVGHTRHRDAHAKHHGIVKAQFRVLPDLPERLRQGIFATPATYPAYIRFSNGRVSEKNHVPGQPHPIDMVFQHDALPDARGMAIKVMGVPGEKLLEDERETQDFILVNHPTFFASSLLNYVQVLEQAKTAPEKLAGFFHSHASPLSTTYFSQTAYALGPDLVTRYRAVPVIPEPEAELDEAQYRTLAARPDKANYLQQAMAMQLASGKAVFDFYLDVPDERGQVDVDDATQDWRVPSWRVAQLEIPTQWFLSMLQQQFARDISFNPWHSLKAHQPLGPINRARREVYVATAAARRTDSSSARPEPTGDEAF